jgi:hypothetical protein
VPACERLFARPRPAAALLSTLHPDFRSILNWMITMIMRIVKVTKVTWVITLRVIIIGVLYKLSITTINLKNIYIYNNPKVASHHTYNNNPNDPNSLIACKHRFCGLGIFHNLVEQPLLLFFIHLRVNSVTYSHGSIQPLLIHRCSARIIRFSPAAFLIQRY